MLYYNLAMEQIPIRVLNQDTTGVLARVAAGEVVEVTNRGVVVARIVPSEPGELDDLVARGRVVPATVSGPFPMPTGDPDGTDSTQIVSEMREERW
jgi:prevent-host-death family protein